MKQYKVLFSEAARQEMLDIWDYLFTVSYDREIANSEIDKIESFCKNYLPQFPEIGIRRDFIKENVRFFPVGNYSLYYFFDGKEILVAHIVRQSQDVRGVF